MVIDFTSMILGALLVFGFGSGLIIRDAMRPSGRSGGKNHSA